MAEYVSVHANWPSLDGLALDLVCDVDIEEAQDTDTADSRKTASSDEKITHVTLRCEQPEQREDPAIVIRVRHVEQHRIDGIQLLSSAKHIEFYQREYIGSCQGSRITELEHDSIYEANFEFSQPHDELTLKFLKLADSAELIVYCLQITMSNRPSSTSAVPSADLPFDLTRVRSMIDETHLSSNARQFMNDLQHMQTHRRAKEAAAPQFNLSSLMSMMTGMKTASATPKPATAAAAPLASILSEIKSSLNDELKGTSSQDGDKTTREYADAEQRLRTYVDKRFDDLQQRIDARFDRLEAMLTPSKET